MSKLLKGLSVFALTGCLSNMAFAADSSVAANSSAAASSNGPAVSNTNSPAEKAVASIKEALRNGPFTAREVIAKEKAAHGDNSPVTDAEVREYVRNKLGSEGANATDKDIDELVQVFDTFGSIGKRVGQSLTDKDFDALTAAFQKLDELSEKEFAKVKNQAKKEKKEKEKKAKEDTKLPKTSVGSIAVPVVASVVAAVAGASIVARRRNA